MDELFNFMFVQNILSSICCSNLNSKLEIVIVLGELNKKNHYKAKETSCWTKLVYTSICFAELPQGIDTFWQRFPGSILPSSKA